ncbi:MAG: hypothetical protein U1F81_08030 [Verrucomicrobiaceae bacterium]
MTASTVFPMIPTASKSLWFFGIISLVLVGLLFLMGWLAWSMQHAEFTVSNDGLRLQGDLWGRTIPLKSLKLDEAVVTNLNTDTAHQPTRRTMEPGCPATLRAGSSCATESKACSTSPTAPEWPAFRPRRATS